MKDTYMEPFGDVGDKDHKIGDMECNAGWCGDNSGYPQPCECGGLIHAEFGDEDYDGDFWLYTKCDKCGESV